MTQRGDPSLKKPKRGVSAPKKIKVTKREAAKVPWYERPVLLFGVIAAVLAVGGVLMAYVYRQSSGPTTVFGGAEGDSLAVATAAGEAAGDGTSSADSLRSSASQRQDSASQGSESHVLAVRTMLPPAAPGHLLPPLHIETLADGSAARSAYRAARDLSPPGAPGPVYGFIAASELATALSAEASGARAALIEQLAPAEPDRNWVEFEVQRDSAGKIYVLGYVSTEVAEQFGALGAALSLPPAVAEEAPPKWQFWKKHESGPVVVRAGATISLNPDPSPGATCALVLPFDRIARAAAREIIGGVARRTVVVDVVLQ